MSKISQKNGVVCFPISFLLSAVFIVIITAGCNSDTNGTEPVKSMNISGQVSAPGGAIAQLKSPTFSSTMLAMLFGNELQAAITGLSGVSTAEVELIRVDGNGNQVGDIIASAITDTNGMYSIETTATMASDLVVQVSSSSAIVRAFVTSDSVDITPVTEYVYQSVFAEIATNTNVVLSELSPSELEALVKYFEQFSLSFSATTIDIAVSQVTTIADNNGFVTEVQNYSDNQLDLTGSGNWHWLEVTGPNNCGDVEGNLINNFYISMMQTGSDLSVTSPLGNYSAQLSGNEITNLPLSSGPEDGGTYVVTEFVLTVIDETRITGHVSWNWTNSVESCSGTDNVLITKYI